MARGRRLGGITAVVIVALATVAGASRFDFSVSPGAGADVVEPIPALPAEVAAVALESQPDGWARSEHRRHTGFGNRFLFGLLDAAGVLTVVILAVGFAARDRREPALRAWRAGEIQLRAPPLATSA